MPIYRNLGPVFFKEDEGKTYSVGSLFDFKDPAIEKRAKASGLFVVAEIFEIGEVKHEAAKKAPKSTSAKK